MRVVHVSTHDLAGGAARAAYRVHRGLLGLGVDSSMFVAIRWGSDPTVRTPTLDRSVSARTRRLWLRRRIRSEHAVHAKSRPTGFEKFTDDRAELGRELTRELPPADVIHLHWTADFLDHTSFFERHAQSAPLVWTLHDMNPFTGGCHYDGGCGRFRGACGACPQLGSERETDLSRRIWERKRDALSRIPGDRLQLVAGSEWMARQATESSLLGRFPSTHFHYGVDTERFHPVDRTRARAELGIESDAIVLLFVSDSVENRRKGFAQLVAAIDRLPAGMPALLLSIGDGVPQETGRLPHRHLGRISDDAMLATVYSAADLFLMPSLQEAYGLTTLEAMACGTPAIGFDTGGVREVIRGGETGALVPVGDVAALAAGIAELVSDPPRLARMRERCLEVVREAHSIEGEARRYLEIYRSLTAGDRTASGAAAAGGA